MSPSNSPSASSPGPRSTVAVTGSPALRSSPTSCMAAETEPEPPVAGAPDPDCVDDAAGPDPEHAASIDAPANRPNRSGAARSADRADVNGTERWRVLVSRGGQVCGR